MICFYLKSIVELSGFLEGDLQFDFLVVCPGEDVVPPGLEDPKVVLEVVGCALLRLLEVVFVSAHQGLDLRPCGLKLLDIA